MDDDVVVVDMIKFSRKFDTVGHTSSRSRNTSPSKDNGKTLV